LNDEGFSEDSPSEDDDDDEENNSQINGK